MNIVFRADASTQIGTGHVMRCLTLANQLKANGHQCMFISRAHEGNLLSFIESQGFDIISLEVCEEVDYELAHANWLGATQARDALDCLAKLGERELEQVDWLVVDHYALDELWELELRQLASQIMVIDDLADRRHVCELLLDQNLGRQVEDYQSLVPDSCHIFTGPRYALLRPEFAEMREYSLLRRQKHIQLSNLLISLGGVDKDNVTGQVLEALQKVKLPSLEKVTVIMGTTAPHLTDVREKAELLPWDVEVAVNVSDMAKRMANADLAIGAAGSTSWERCCLGLPTVMFVLAENQRVVANYFQQLKLGDVISDMNNFKVIVEQFNQDRLQLFSHNISSLVDGQGSNKVIKRLIGGM